MPARTGYCLLLVIMFPTLLHSQQVLSVNSFPEWELSSNVERTGLIQFPGKGAVERIIFDSGDPGIALIDEKGNSKWQINL